MVETRTEAPLHTWGRRSSSQNPPSIEWCPCTIPPLTDSDEADLRQHLIGEEGADSR